MLAYYIVRMKGWAAARKLSWITLLLVWRNSLERGGGARRGYPENQGMLQVEAAGNVPCATIDSFF